MLLSVLVLSLVSSSFAGRRHALDTPPPPSSFSYPGPRYFPSQRQDHFDGTNDRTWSQAYYVNDTFFDVRTGPVFLCVGGEGPAFDGSVVVASVHCNVAVESLSRHGALMVALQHRYYGCHGEPLVDCPVDRFSGNPDGNPDVDLRYLSSSQALEDLATFHEYVVSTYNLTSKNKWISFGGSYPGMLAAWTRTKYPHLFHAAVSSSAPVRAKLEMVVYNDIVANAYEVESVGGSTTCRAAIADGHATIGTLLGSDAGRRRLATAFDVKEGADWLANRTNAASFAGEGVAYFPAQGNDPSSTDPVSNIRTICDVMTNDTYGDELSRLAFVARTQRDTSSERGNVVEGTQTMPDFWGYQTCTEFGFYQTCDVGSSCFFTQGLSTLSDQVAFCQTEFNVSVDLVAENVRQSNRRYGSDHPSGSRVLWVNGEVDPWHGLSVLKSLSPSMPAIWVPGASHHAWTHPSRSDDQPSVVEAREKIRKQVDLWLNEPLS